MKIRAYIAVTDSGYIREAIFNDKIGYEGKKKYLHAFSDLRGEKEILFRLLSFNGFVYQIIQPFKAM